MEFDKYEKLKKLKTLLDNGLINQDEFNKLKNEILFSDDLETTPQKEIQIVKKKSNNIMLLVSIVGIVLFVYNLNKIKDSFESNLDEVNKSSQSNQDSENVSPVDNSNANNSSTCKICGQKFTGDGYDEIDGVWQRNTNIQTELCSPNCGMIEGQRIDEKYNTILKKHGYQPINSNQSSTSNHAQPNSNGFFTGSDGQLHQVSPCGNCRHSGFINMGDGIQVCPMCNGKGEIIH